ncbi:DUF4192 family protein [Micrococcoides hystricis]|uniref:DUF4192 family protein n=1 Tax=Micrococcoides hystricis TaxID=1572761 RepID=A0ABV6P6W1_9MICC
MTKKNQRPWAATAADSSHQDTFIAHSRADLIVYVRQVLGFQPRNSLVLITVCGQRLTSVLRVNLPAADINAEQADEYLQDVLATYGERVQNRHLLVLIFSDEHWLPDQQPPFHELFKVARQQQKRTDGQVRFSHAYFFGADQIDTVFPGSRHSEDATALALDSTALNAQLTVAGFCSAKSAEEQIQRLVAAPWANQTQLRNQVRLRAKRVRQFEASLNFDVRHARHLFGRLEKWDKWLRRIAATGVGSRQDKNAAMIRHHRNDAIELVTDLEHVRTRDLVLVLASFPLMTTVAASFQHFFSEPVRNQLFKSLDPELTDTDVPAESWQINFLSRALMAATDTAPDWQRTTACNALLRELLPIAEGDSRQAILGLLAWSEWAMGRSSLAMVYLEKATAEDPTYRFTMLFNALVSTGRVAEWASREP